MKGKKLNEAILKKIKKVIKPREFTFFMNEVDKKVCSFSKTLSPKDRANANSMASRLCYKFSKKILIEMLENRPMNLAFQSLEEDLRAKTMLFRNAVRSSKSSKTAKTQLT